MRSKWRAWGLGALIAAGLILSNGTLSADDGPVVHVSAVVKDGTVRLEIEANGPFEYTTSRPDANLYVVDLSGVAAGYPVDDRLVASDLVMRYRVISYTAGSKPLVRVYILLKKGVEPRLERKSNQDLTLLVSRTADASSPARSMPSPRSSAIVPAAPIVPAASKSPEVRNPGAGGAIRQVHLTQNGESTEVTIIGSGALTYHALRLQSPDRLVLDFAGSHLSTSENHIASNLDPVREIRLGQFTPETSRVVIDLLAPVRYSIKGEGNIVTISFARSGTPGTTTAESGNINHQEITSSQAQAARP
jgi:hypothetical protein